MTEILSRDTFKAGLVAEGAVTVPNVVAGTDALNKNSADLAYAAINHTHTDTRDYQFLYDSVNTMADPSTGKVRTNTDVGTPSTQIAFSKTTNLGIDATDTFKSLAVGDLIYFQQLDNAANWGRFTISGAPVNNSTWWQLPVTAVSQQGTINKNQTVLVRFTFGTGGGGSGGMTQDAADLRYVNVTGDTMTGSLTVGSDLFLSKPTGQDLEVKFQVAGSDRWSFGKTWDTEGGVSAGSNFAIGRFDNGGNWIDNPMVFYRATGEVTVAADPLLPLGVATKQYVDARTPKTTVSSTAPSNPAVNDLWVDLSGA